MQSRYTVLTFSFEKGSLLAEMNIQVRNFKQLHVRCSTALILSNVLFQVISDTAMAHLRDVFMDAFDENEDNKIEICEVCAGMASEPIPMHLESCNDHFICENSTFLCSCRTNAHMRLSSTHVSASEQSSLPPLQFIPL